MTTQDTPAPPEQAPQVHEPPLGARYISIERRTSSETVFLVDDVPFRSTMPKPTHWSVAWSDVMMTMFVLFLSMYVYKAADQDFLNRQSLEIVGGDTTEALDSDQFSAVAPPITPIAPGVPLMTNGTIRKVESVDLRDIEVDSAFSSIGDKTRVEKEIVEIPDDRPIPQQPEPDQQQRDAGGETAATSQPPAAQPGMSAGIGRPEVLYELYRSARSAVSSHNLGGIARVDMIPGTMVRLTLATDGLFTTGQAEFSEGARTRMEQLAMALQTAPYMLNVVGHTDNVPMYSERYPSNWELSLARAATVARFFIEEMGMNPNQFVVSGYGAHRPTVANTTTENRRQNRRVEIIITKRLPNRPAVNQQP